LGVALIGTLSSSVFLALALMGVIRFRRDASQQLHAIPGDAHLPPVSVLKPVHGLEAQLKENIESFFRQDYPNFEILFASDRADDPALEVVREITARYPHIRCRVLVVNPPWPNPVVYAFHSMAEAATHEILVTADSDVEVSSNYLREVVAPLLDPQVGMVTCVYRGKNVAGFFSGLTAIGMSVEMTAGVLVANLMEGMKFGLGPTTVVRKDSLARIGGYAALQDYMAYDFAIGNLIAKAGYRVVLSGHIIDHVVNQPHVAESVAVGANDALLTAQGTFWNGPDFLHALWRTRIHRMCRIGTLGSWRDFVESSCAEPTCRSVACRLDGGS
jgi:ceramide glucosyltransferase